MSSLQDDQIFLFGDQTADFAPSLRNVVTTAKKSSHMVQKLLSDAEDVFVIESRKLVGDVDIAENDRPDRDTFANLLARPEEYEKLMDRTGIYQTVLTCVARLGELMLHVEQDSSMLRSSGRTIHALGLCTGLLPAVVLSAAQNLQDLAYLSNLMVGVAFRLRIELHRRSWHVESRPGTWGYLFVGLRADEIEAALDSFHQASRTPQHHRAYVAVAAETWSAVFGPPSTMQKLVKDPAVATRASITELYRANGSVHAPHLPQANIESIMGEFQSNVALASRKPSPAVQITSTSSCQVFAERTLAELLERTLDDILTLRLDHDGCINAVAASVKEGLAVRLVVIGGESSLSTLQRALQARKVDATTVEGFDGWTQLPKARSGSGKVAIVGVSGRFPGSESVDEFWASLLEGKEQHRKVPESRFALDAWQHALGPDAQLPYGCFLERPGQFDARLFSISPREAAQMDPIHRLVMLTTWEALEAAGYNPGREDLRRISAFVAQSSDDWRDVEHQHGIDNYYVPSIARAFGSGRLHYFFKWEAPAFNVDAACGSSAVAITLACEKLVNRQCDMAVAAGGMLACSPDAYAGLAKGQFLSPTGGCKVFRADVDGYTRGESVSAVVLKRLEDAEMNNDNILAVIDGFARNHSAHASSITHPHQGAQERVFRQALDAAGAEPREIGYAELHGTGTSAGDKCEVGAVANVLSEKRDGPLVLGAVKANIGHGEAGACLAALIKVSMVLKNQGTIPPQPGFNNPVNPPQLNPEFPSLRRLDMHVADGSKHLETGKKVLLNCFDASGGNTCMVLSPPPASRQRATRDGEGDGRTHHVVVCSGHTFKAMKGNERRILDYVMTHKDESPNHLAYTTTARRIKHHQYRTAWVVQNMKDLGKQLLRDQSNTEENVRKRGSIAFTFTGQGSVYRAMAKPLLQSSPRFRDTIKACQAVCDMNGFPSVIEYINGTEALPQAQAAQEQLSLVAVQIALVHLLRSWGLQPDLVLGHSIGEYAALYAAGVLSLSDTLYLVGRRALLVEECCDTDKYSMLVLPMPSDQAQALLDKFKLVECSVACKNTSRSTVVSGPSNDLTKLQNDLKEGRGVETKRLPVPYGFHSAQMEPVARGLRKLAQDAAQFSAPNFSCASTLHGRIVPTGSGSTFGPEYLARQTLEPVEFVAAVQDAENQGVVNDNTIWVEIGPDQANTSMVRQILGIKENDRLLPAIKSNQDCWATLGHLVSSAYIRGHDIDWNACHMDYEASKALRLVDLPRYAFDLTDHWWPYVHPQVQAHDSAMGTAVQSQSNRTSLPSLEYIGPFLQYVAHVSADSDETVTAEFISRVNHPEMMAAAAGHLVDGRPIFPGSAFCEMAYAAAEYLVPQHPALPSTPHISSLILGKLDMRRPLIITTSADDSIVRTRAVCHNQGVSVEFFHEAGPHDVTPLGSVVIRFERSPALLTKTGPTTAFLVQARCEALMKAVRSGEEGHVLRKSLLYQLFQRYIGYGEGFQGIQECFLGGSITEAACVVRLPTSPSATGDRAALNMYWRDCVFHLAGFMLNGHPDGPSDKASIAVAVEEILFEDELNAVDTYTVYTHMAPTETGHVGDVYVFQGQRLVALCSNMVYHTVAPRRANMGRQPPQSSTKIETRARALTSSFPKPNPPIQPPSRLESSSRPQTHHHSQPQAQPQPQTKIQEAQPRGRKQPVEQKQHISELILRLIAEETGWPVEDLNDDTAVADLGIDSLMNISLVSRLRSEKGIDVSPAKFRQCVTVADIRKEFGTSTGSVGSQRSEHVHVEIETQEPEQAQGLNDSTTASSSPGSDTSCSPNVLTPNTDPLSRSSGSSPVPKVVELAQPMGATSQATNEVVEMPDELKDTTVEVFLIQGEPNPTTPPLFLVPDGSGSIASFLQLPNFEHDICVYGLHSPWVDNPAGFTCTIEQASQLYVVAIREKQPHGPYLLGGWSSGCVFAYEAARVLAEDHDEEVLGLVIVDMHRPKPLPDWIETTKELWEYWCETTGLDNVFAPLPDAQDLEKHLISNFRALNRYTPKPMKPGKTPKHGTLIVWAKKGMGNGLKREDYADLPDPLEIGTWFCFDRTDFGPNGWEELVGEKIQTVAIDGHHRSIMVPPDAYQLVKVIDEALERFLA